MTRMSASCDQVAESGAHAREAAQGAHDDAHRGREVVNHARSWVQGLAQDVDKACQVIAELEHHSKSIGAVLGVIRSIADADQSIGSQCRYRNRSSREQGPEFAVVADEVRTLANRTQATTEEIHEPIERLQCGCGNARRSRTSTRSQHS